MCLKVLAIGVIGSRECIFTGIQTRDRRILILGKYLILIEIEYPICFGIPAS